MLDLHTRRGVNFEISYLYTFTSVLSSIRAQGVEVAVLTPFD